MALINDPETQAFLYDVMDTATRRYIATLLGEVEAYTGEKNKAISDMVKDDVNRMRRVLSRKLTGIEVESAHPE